VFSFLSAGDGRLCEKQGANTASSSTPKPAASTSAASPKANEKKPPSANPVPADWIRIIDDQGYEFMVPQGTQHHRKMSKALMFISRMRLRHTTSVSWWYAFKDKTLTRMTCLSELENISQIHGRKRHQDLCAQRVERRL